MSKQQSFQPLVPREYRPFMQNNFELKKGSAMSFDFPENAIVNGITGYITVPYSVGATAPTGLMEAQAYGILSRLKVESSRPDGKNWDINNIAIRTHCTKFKGKKFPEPAFDLATSGGAKELIVPFYIDFTQNQNPFSKYATGANTYTQGYKLRLDWNENMNSDGGLFTAVENFVIDKSNIKVRLDFDQHVLPAGHEILVNPSRLMMRNMNQSVKGFTQTGNLSDKFEELRDYVAVHIAALKTATTGGLITATDEIFEDFKAIEIANSTGSNAQTFMRSSWLALQKLTAQWHNDEISALEAGYRTLPMVDDHRLGQAVKVAAKGDVNINFEQVKVVASHSTSLELTYEYLTLQD